VAFAVHVLQPQCWQQQKQRTKFLPSTITLGTFLSRMTFETTPFCPLSFPAVITTVSPRKIFHLPLENISFIALFWTPILERKGCVPGFSGVMEQEKSCKSKEHSPIHEFVFAGSNLLPRSNSLAILHSSYAHNRQCFSHANCVQSFRPEHLMPSSE
jgi:hypothetical protein